MRILQTDKIKHMAHKTSVCKRTINSNLLMFISQTEGAVAFQPGLALVEG